MSIKAMKLALKALEEYQEKGAPFMSCDSAVNVLRQAIAEEERQERFFCERCGKRLSDGTHTCTPPAKAEKQEPMAYLVAIRHDGKGKWEEFAAIDYREPPGVTVIRKEPLYTHPPKRVVFPTMLRKMWSGTEVQAWLDEHVNKENT
jgi:hypothetical protein